MKNKILYRKLRRQMLREAKKLGRFRLFRLIRQSKRCQLRRIYYNFCLYKDTYANGKIKESVFINNPIVSDINEILRYYQEGEYFLDFINNKLYIEHIKVIQNENNNV